MCFNLVKISSEIIHSTYSLKGACYWCSVFVKNIIYPVLMRKLIPCCVAFKVRELKAVSSGEQYSPHIHGAFPLVPIYMLNKYLLSE